MSLGYENGKRKRKTLYGRTRAEVAGRLRDLQAEMASGLPVTDDTLTVGSFMESWITEVLPGAVKPATRSSYSANARKHIIPELGHITLAELNPQQVQRFLKRKLDSGL